MKNQLYKCQECGRETDDKDTKHGSVCSEYINRSGVTARCGGFLVPKILNDTRPCVPCIDLGIFEMRNGALTHPLRGAGGTYDYDDGSEFWFYSGNYAADNKPHPMDLVRLVYKVVPIEEYATLCAKAYPHTKENRS